MKKTSEIKRQWLKDQTDNLIKHGATQAEIAERLGVKRQYLNNLLGGKKNITDSFIDKFTDVFNVNFLGLQKSSIVSDFAKTMSPAEDNLSLKYYYDLPATASNIEDLCDNELYQDYQLYRVPGFEGCAGFPVVGDSMIPTMQANDIVAVEPQHVQQIINGEIYLVITRDGQRTIKRLVVEESDDDVLLRCISDNPDKSLYKDFLIQGDAVYRVYRVRGAIRLDLFT